MTDISNDADVAAAAPTVLTQEKHDTTLSPRNDYMSTYKAWITSASLLMILVPTLSAQAEQSVNVPTSLTQMGEYGENIYDAAKAQNWKEADAKLAALKQTIQKVSQPLSKAENEQVKLQREIAALADTVRKRDSWATMREANQVTLVAADLTAPYHPRIPADVARLDYGGRELEIWSTAKDLPALKKTAQNLRQTWNQLRPEVEAHNAAEAKKFDRLIAQIDRAQSVAEYRNLAAPVLDEVDNLEKVF